MQLKSLIVDDEKLSRDLLRSMLAELCPQTTVVAEADCSDDALEAIENQKPDIVFLDVEIPGNDGFELLEKVRGAYGFQTVFVTAFSQYAVKAIKAGASDYLLKPLDGAELKNTFNKLYHRHIENARAESQKMGDISAGNIAIPHQKGFRVLKPMDIVRLEADDNYTYLYFENEPRIIASKPLKYFEEKLSPVWFFRPHKSHLINFCHFKEFLSEDGGYAVMADGRKVPVSRLRMNEFLEFINTFTSRV